MSAVVPKRAMTHTLYYDTLYAVKKSSVFYQIASTTAYQIADTKIPYIG